MAKITLKLNGQYLQIVAPDVIVAGGKRCLSAKIELSDAWIDTAITVLISNADRSYSFIPDENNEFYIDDVVGGIYGVSVVGVRDGYKVTSNIQTLRIENCPDPRPNFNE